MKRGGRLARNTPLARGAAMERTAWRRAEGWLPGRAPSEVPARPGVGAGQAARAVPFPVKVAALLDARDEWCQRCGSPRDLERHHRRGKASGGSGNRPHSQCACNGVRLCRDCHIWAHRHGRREAGDQGFVVSQSQEEPGSVSVMRGSEDGGGASMWPSCDGQWTSEPSEVAA